MRTLCLLLSACVASSPGAPDDTGQPTESAVETDVEVYAPPEGATTADHDPDETFRTWPDQRHTRPDPSTATGIRVAFEPVAKEQLSALLPKGFTLIEALEVLDGFGTTAGITLAFTAPVDPDTFRDALRFVRVSDGEEVASETWWTEDGLVSVTEPLQPLDPTTAYALLVTDSLRDLDGEPVFPSVAMHQQAHGASTVDAALAGAWADGLASAAVDADDIVHGTVFTTQSLHDQDLAVVELLRDRGPTITATPGSCVFLSNGRRCQAELVVGDVLGEDGTLGADEVPSVLGTYTLPVTITLPSVFQDGPYPVLFHGHGLGGTRGESHGVASTVSPLGVAVVAIDAPRHGDHPLASEGDLKWILEFFGISITELSMDVAVLRDDFRLAAWERVQLLDAIADGLDVNGDGHNDLDTTRLAVSGHSLGGVMGVQLTAMVPGVQSTYLSVPGGRVSTIVHRGQIFGPLVSLLAPPGTLPADLDRFFPLLQMAIERGDPLVWASRVVDGDRDIYVGQVIDDTIMPNSTTRALARALEVERVGPKLQDVVGLVDHEGVLPVSANVDGHTRVLYQQDSLREGDEILPANHSDVFGADSGRDQLRHWVSTWLDDGTSEILDPFAE